MKRLYAILLFLPVLFLTCKNDTITITTSSEQALQAFLKGREFVEKIRIQDAIEYLERAVEQDSNFALAYLYLSFTETNVTERYALIEKAKTLSDDVSTGERLFILAIEAGAFGYSKKQEGYFQELVEDYPNDERALTSLANFYFEQREYEKAIVHYKRAVQLNPNFSVPYNQLGYAYRYQQNYPAAEESFKKYIKLIPDSPNPYDSYAELLLKMGEYEVSIETYEKALEIDPDFSPSHRGIATNLIYMREYQKARSQLRHLYKIASEDHQRINAYYGLAVSYLAEGDIENTLNEIEKLYQMAEEGDDTPSMIGNLYTMTVLLFENNRLIEAERKLDQSRKMLESATFSEGIKKNLQRGYWYQNTRLALKKGQIEEADKYAEKYRENAERTENPLHMMYYHTLSGLIARAEKDYDRAISEFKQTNLDDPFNRYRLAQVYIAKGEKDKAIEELEFVVRYNSLAGLTYTMIRGRAEKQLGLLKME